MKAGFASGLNVGCGKSRGIKDDFQISGLSYCWDNELGKWNIRLVFSRDIWKNSFGYIKCEMPI